MNKRPLVFVALAYICGIILGRYCFIPWWICIFIVGVLSTAIFIPSPDGHRGGEWKKVCFYLSIAVIGYLIYQVVISYQIVNLHTGVEVKFHPHRLIFLKEHIRKIIYYNFPPGEERNLLAGLFLGERHKISFEVLKIFRCTNTMHILAISGLHVGFIGLILIGVLRLVFIPRKTAAMLAILGILLYVSMVGWRPPAFRSAVIFCILFMGWVLDRPVDNINSLFLAALVILLITPQALFKVGFQLSFVVVFALLLMAPIITKHNSYILQALSGSTTAWLSSLPLIAYCFKTISPISILANIVVVPTIGIVIALGFTSILLGQLYLPISGVFNCTNYYLLKWLIWFIERLAHVPGGYFYISEFPLYMVFLSYAILGLILIFLLQKKRFVVK